MNKRSKNILGKSLFISGLSFVCLSIVLPNVKSYGLYGQECNHSGNHYLAKEATCGEAGNKEFYACCKCVEQFLTYPGGSFKEAGQYNEPLNQSHIAYVAPTGNHPSFDDEGHCTNGCGATLKDAYGFSTGEGSSSTSVTLSDIGLNYTDYQNLPSSNTSHLWGDYNYVGNNGIDLTFDYSYTYNNTDSWMYYYLFNASNEDGIVIRINTLAIDGTITGYIYSQEVQYEGNLPYKAGSVGSYFTCNAEFDGEGYVRTVATLVNPTTNEVNVKLYFGSLSDNEDHPALINGNPLNINVVLGENYFADNTHQKIRISNHGSNGKIKSHVIGHVAAYKNESGTIYGNKSITNGIEIPVMEKDGYEFLGWYDQDNKLVSQGSIYDKDITLTAKYVQYTDLLTNQQISISPNATQTITINTSIGTNNFLKLLYSSNQPLKGVFNITYYSMSRNEPFYLDNKEHEFRTFLDVFRTGGYSKGTRKFASISLTNIGSEEAIVTIDKLSHSARNCTYSDVLYLKDDSIRLGVSLSLGGAISSLQNINKNTVEYINDNNEVKIRSRSKITDGIKKEIATNPNLINIHDVGREVQQSYYFNVDSENGYTRANYLGAPCQYNPVQSGDQYNNQSKIIDFKQTTKSLWIKVQSLDWAQKNSLSKAYMTNTYTVKNGLVYVHNTFINWFGFTDYTVPTSGYAATSTPHFAIQELPAVYTVHPLDYFSSVFDGKEIFDNRLGWNVGTTAIESVSKLTVNNGDGTYRPDLEEGTYHYEFRKHSNNWCGYLNEDKFGVAVYMNAGNYNHDSIDRHVYIAGNYKNTHNISDSYNRSYLNSSNKSTTPTETSFLSNPIPSYKIDNTNYISTALGFFPQEFDELSWDYAIGADDLSVLKTKFATVKANNELYNDFTKWAGALI